MIVQNKKTLHWLKEKLASSIDVVFQELDTGKSKAQFVYINSITDGNKIQSDLIKPFFELNDSQKYMNYMASLPNIKAYENDEKTLKQILRGSVAIIIKHQIFLVDEKKFVNQSVSETRVESTIQGPDTGLNEVIESNLNLIRHRYHQESLKVEKSSIGSLSDMEIVLLYDEQLVNHEVLKEVKQSLSSANPDILQSAGQLQRNLTKKKRNLFPTTMITERPDRIAYNLSKGKIVFLLEGSPFVVIVPAVFYDFISSMDDLYQPYWVGRFLVILRYIGLFISVVLPAVYVAITSYNPEILRVQLTFSIAGSRVSVPYPSYIEILFMLLMMELLIEASIRLPKSISPAATTVGGLILGQAATQAGLVSNIMIIIVAAVAIANFVIPINEMAFAMRVVKYGLLLITTLSGLVGVWLGVIGLFMYLVSLESFGQPYLKIFSGRLAYQKSSSTG